MVTCGIAICNISVCLLLFQIDVMGQSIYDLSHPCDHDEIREMIGVKSHPSDDSGHHRDVFIRMKSTITSKGRSVHIKSASYKVGRRRVLQLVLWLWFCGGDGGSGGHDGNGGGGGHDGIGGGGHDGGSRSGARRGIVYGCVLFDDHDADNYSDDHGHGDDVYHQYY